MTDKGVSIVLVNGGFVDGSGWQGVHNVLTADGYEVLVVQNPTISLAGDVAVTKPGQLPNWTRLRMVWKLQSRLVPDGFADDHQAPSSIP